MIRSLLIIALLWLFAGVRPAGAIMFFWYSSSPGSSGNSSAQNKFKPENCGFSDWWSSIAMDSFVGDSQSQVIDQWGPPDEKVPDDNGGRYLIYRKKDDLKESFFVDKKGKVYSWQWNSPTGSDNMKAFVKKVEDLAFNNDCAGYDTVQTNKQAMDYVLAKAAYFHLPLKPGAHFEPVYMNVMGVWYQYGIHYKKDPVKAFQHYSLAAYMADPVGQDNLARCYRDGIGTTVDLLEARWYFKISADDCKYSKDDLAKLDADHPELIGKERLKME